MIHVSLGIVVGLAMFGVAASAAALPSACGVQGFT